jgi:hypothetical protein
VSGARFGKAWAWHQGPIFDWLDLILRFAACSALRSLPPVRHQVVKSHGDSADDDVRDSQVWSGIDF